MDDFENRALLMQMLKAAGVSRRRRQSRLAAKLRRPGQRGQR